MDNKIMYGIGGVAVIGIIAYLYNKKKKDDALKLATTATPPPSTETIIDMGGMSPTLLEDSMVVMPDGSIVDGSVIAVETNPTSMVAVDPIKVPVNMMATSPVSFTDPKNMTMASSSTAKFDGGFANAIGTTTTTTQKLSGCGAGGKCPTCYRCKGGTCYPAYQVIIQGQSTPTLADFNNCMGLYGTAKFDGGFNYADGYGCSVDPVLGV
jgi:hypothetical protein